MKSKKDIIFTYIENEVQRQTEMIGLIPSENNCSPAVCEALGIGALTSKYAEGYPGARYYEGNENIDLIEIEAQNRLKKLFGVAHVNVQPYSGSPANSAIEMALMKPGECMMGLALSSGGHLTHGHPQVTFSGRFFETVQFEVGADARIDMEVVKKLALEKKPKVMMIGTTAYPFVFDFAAYREIADMIGAWLVADISHITGLVVGGEHPSPAPWADVIMSTTHKTFRGPRGAMIMVTDRGLARDSNLAKKIDGAVFPGLQGGPHNGTTAAIAIVAGEAARPEFKLYAKQIRLNAEALAGGLRAAGVKLVGGGTENHLMILDLSDFGEGLGTQVAYAMNVAGIYANKNTVPAEPCSPMFPSGVRIGTPLVTTRGMKEAEMQKIANWIARVIEIVRDEQTPEDKKGRKAFIAEFKKRALVNKDLLVIRKEVADLAGKFPLFTW